MKYISLISQNINSESNIDLASICKNGHSIGSVIIGDGYLFVNTTANLMTGDFVKVIVTDTNDYDLIGEIYNG